MASAKLAIKFVKRLSCLAGLHIRQHRGNSVSTRPSVAAIGGSIYVFFTSTGN